MREGRAWSSGMDSGSSWRCHRWRVLGITARGGSGGAGRICGVDSDSAGRLSVRLIFISMGELRMQIGIHIILLSSFDVRGHFFYEGNNGPYLFQVRGTKVFL